MWPQLTLLTLAALFGSAPVRSMTCSTWSTKAGWRNWRALTLTAIVRCAVSGRLPQDTSWRHAASRTHSPSCKISPVSSSRGACPKPKRALFDQVAARLLEGAVGLGDNDFKIELARRAIVRALAQAASGRPQSQTDKRIA
jgi:hypothetical protein